MHRNPLIEWQIAKIVFEYFELSSYYGILRRRRYVSHKMQIIDKFPKCEQMNAFDLNSTRGINQ